MYLVGRLNGTAAAAAAAAACSDRANVSVVRNAVGADWSRQTP